MKNIEEFLKALDVEGLFKVLNEASSWGFSLIVKSFDENNCQLLTKIDSTKRRHPFYFAEVRKIDDGIYLFSRNNYLTSKDRFAVKLKSHFTSYLPKSIDVGGVPYKAKIFGHDFLYVSKELTDQRIPLDNGFCLLNVKCTKAGNVFVPSKTGTKIFLMADGVIYSENLVTPISYNTESAPTFDELTPDDVMILASQRGLEVEYDANYLDIKNEYSNEVINKMLKI